MITAYREAALYQGRWGYLNYCYDMPVHDFLGKESLIQIRFTLGQLPAEFGTAPN